MDNNTTTPELDKNQTNQPVLSQPEKARNNRKKWLIIGGVVLLLALLALVAAKVLLGGSRERDYGKGRDMGRMEKKEDRAGGGGSFVSQYGQNCQQKESVAFTSAPVPIDQIGQIEPMGKVEDGHVTPTDHQYVGPKDPRAADNTTDVVMPADGRVVMVASMPAQYIGDRAQQTAPEDHRIIVSYSCKLYSIFIHVHQLSPALQSVVGTIPPNEQKNVSIELKAGEKIGKIGSNPVDWTMVDTSKNLTGFITPSFYAGEAWKIHTIDPFPLYSGTLKQQLIAKSLRSEEPYGGKIDHDQPGKLVGNWFREGTNGYSGKSMDRYWDGHLSIAPDYIDGSATIASLGNWQGKAHQFAVKSSALKPNAVTAASGAVKYELVQRSYMRPDGQPWTGSGLVKGIKVETQNSQLQGTLLLQITAQNKLKFEAFPGKSAAEVTDFTAAAQIYTR